MFHTSRPPASWITYPQVWLVGVNMMHKVQLCLKVLGHVPGSVDANCQGVHYFSKSTTEGGWKVSAFVAKITKTLRIRRRSNLATRHTPFLWTFKIRLQEDKWSNKEKKNRLGTKGNTIQQVINYYFENTERIWIAVFVLSELLFWCWCFCVSCDFKDSELTWPQWYGYGHTPTLYSPTSQ